MPNSNQVLAAVFLFAGIFACGAYYFAEGSSWFFSLNFPLTLTGIGSIYGVVLLWSKIDEIRAKKRSRQMEAFARASGMGFQTDILTPDFNLNAAKSDDPDPQEFQAQQNIQEEFRKLRRGQDINLHFPNEIRLYALGDSAKTTRNIMYGKYKDADFYIFDYCYTIRAGSEGSDREHAQTVFCFRYDRLNLPAFAMRPEKLWHKAASLAGWQDLDFDTHPDFSKKYLLRAADETAIRSMFKPKTLSLLEQCENLNIEGFEKEIIVYQPGKLICTSELGSVAQEAKRIYDCFNAT